jgi:hypothetical protein
MFDSNKEASSFWDGFTNYTRQLSGCESNKALRKAEVELSCEAQFLVQTLK